MLFLSTTSVKDSMKVFHSTVFPEKVFHLSFTWFNDGPFGPVASENTCSMLVTTILRGEVCVSISCFRSFRSFRSFFYNIINHKQILTKYYNLQEHTYCYLRGYKNTMLEQKLLKQITKIKILKEKRKVKKMMIK